MQLIIAYFFFTIILMFLRSLLQIVFNIYSACRTMKFINRRHLFKLIQFIINFTHNVRFKQNMLHKKEK
jgi:hypothetical protein